MSILITCRQSKNTMAARGSRNSNIWGFCHFISIELRQPDLSFN